jgi:hypothetical protein
VNIKITDKAMTSDTTLHSTRQAGNGWAVTWLPRRVLTRNQAITAMVPAETVAGGVGDHTDKRWPFIEGWANELGMTGADAVGKISYYGTHPVTGE